MGNPNASPLATRFLGSVLCVLLLWLTGCASEPPKPASEPAPAPPPEAPAPPAAAQDKKDPLKEAAAVPAAPFEGEGWQSLFDGGTLTGWRETKFSGRGEVEIHDGLLFMKMGDPFTGINWTNEFPNMSYEIALDAMRVSGWGGGLVGVSSLDGMDASENETTKYVTFRQGHWYRIRMRVTQDRLEAWIDQEKLVDVVTTGKKISLRPGEIEESKPFGLACWQTSAALRHIKMRRVDQPADKPKKF